MLFALIIRQKIKQLDDQDLLHLIRANDKNAFAELFRRYEKLVMGVCLKYLKNKMESEDVAMNLFQKLPDLIVKHEIKNFSSWLHSSVRNECLMQLRKKKIDDKDIDSALLKEADDNDDNFKLAELTEQKIQILEEKILELKEEQRVCLNLFYIQNKSYTEIISITKFEDSKVKSYIQNGKRNLKLMLENHPIFNEA